jgi:hypothetical protein
MIRTRSIELAGLLKMVDAERWLSALNVSQPWGGFYTHGRPGALLSEDAPTRMFHVPPISYASWCPGESL